jgi:lipopolysaccharide/colanic/teichoic acid biosynthesis glycosyltransferase
VPDLVQRALAVLGAVVSLPLVVLIAILVRIETPGSPVHRATRIGRGVHPFTCFKIRTMRPGGLADSGPAVTGADDPRITRLGRVLRRFRLDELPQLWNVAAGQMRLVGPRPEAPQFVDPADPLHRLVFSATPGITGLTQLAFVDEARMLGGADPELRYRSEILPAKLRIDAAYLQHRSTALDLWVLGRTMGVLLGRPTTVGEIEARVGPIDLPVSRR